MNNVNVIDATGGLQLPVAVHMHIKVFCSRGSLPVIKDTL